MTASAAEATDTTPSSSCWGKRIRPARHRDEHHPLHGARPGEAERAEVVLLPARRA
jgi:hypothetical protein